MPHWFFCWVSFCYIHHFHPASPHGMPQVSVSGPFLHLYSPLYYALFISPCLKRAHTIYMMSICKYISPVQNLLLNFRHTCPATCMIPPLGSLSRLVSWLASSRKGEERQKKEADTPEWKMSGLTSKGTSHEACLERYKYSHLNKNSGDSCRGWEGVV